ncbi:NAD(P)/FAD-dependent oxidoreductase [Chitinophaga qingshengii]|uniref:NAD(P)/FAD-dependent oxidoreductase n=1 Tax=Chitinophaga qingshengii TaxID=1569794 RepID=A0ABR7TQG9_9BACT|nr:NAD(P)/FAD-dependent oxidoreductase [Chitinophaga qingshengii]MBC9932223.1 NAD(P)/FAD-dependent oxidoreductase [Chitinophaga qingshengii]
MGLEHHIIIIGGGLAGLTSAIHLCRAGLRVTLIEKNTYPRHKVCGEYISNEVLPYLQWLDADPAVLAPAPISRLLLSAANGKTITAPLPLGGFGVSRYTLDHFLLNKALAAGMQLITDTVTGVQYHGDYSEVYTKTQGMITGTVVLGAFGKRSNLDQRLSRAFLRKPAPWLAVKAHYAGTFPDGLVALHNFPGGYCGISKTETGALNICYLVQTDSFRPYGDIDQHREAVLFRNRHLKEIFTQSRPLFDQPLAISQVSFEQKTKVEQHILLTGDTAGLIHPLCGNGMAMAIHSARMAATAILRYCNDAAYDRRRMETDYRREWEQAFSRRMKMGRLLNHLFLKDRLSTWAVQQMASLPAVLPFIIRQTHGRPLNISYS